MSSMFELGKVRFEKEASPQSFPNPGRRPAVLLPHDGIKHYQYLGKTAKLGSQGAKCNKSAAFHWWVTSFSYGIRRPTHQCRNLGRTFHLHQPTRILHSWTMAWAMVGF